MEHLKRMLDPYDVDRIAYIHELTVENEELRRAVRELVMVLAEMPAIAEAMSEAEDSEKDTYEELRKELGFAVSRLCTFWAGLEKREGLTQPTMNGVCEEASSYAK